jgi:hypothetical protein
VKPRIIPSSVRRKQLAEVLNIFRGGEDQACTSRIRDAVMHRVHYGTLDLLVLHADEGLTTVSQRRVAPLQTSSRRIHPLRVHLQHSDLKENSPDIMAIVIVSQSCPWCVCGRNWDLGVAGAGGIRGPRQRGRLFRRTTGIA